MAFNVITGPPCPATCAMYAFTSWDTHPASHEEENPFVVVVVPYRVEVSPGWVVHTVSWVAAPVTPYTSHPLAVQDHDHVSYIDNVADSMTFPDRLEAFHPIRVRAT